MDNITTNKRPRKKANRPPTEAEISEFRRDALRVVTILDLALTMLASPEFQEMARACGDAVEKAAKRLS